MAPTGPILILADDLSGAAELAGAAFHHGLTAEIQTRLDPSASTEALALDTDSRLSTPLEAANRVQSLLQPVHSHQAALLYKKVDSLLRGNVRAEIEAVMQAAGLPRAVLVSANPTRGRTIAGGRYFIDGQPLNQSPLAADPHHPRLSADIQTLLGNGREPLHIVHRHQPLPPSGILVPDIESPADVAQIATLADDQTLMAGAADFFEALLISRGYSKPQAVGSPDMTKPALLLCGSRAAWPARQAACQRAGVPVRVADALDTVNREFGALLVGLGEQKIEPNAALSALASLAQQMLSRLPINTLLIEGGATAAAVAQRMNWTRLSVAARTPSGVGALKPVSRIAPLVLMKPGSYPWPAEIWDAFCRLT
jgi:uncharacterized protein YgbK (DUF1537 family)